MAMLVRGVHAFEDIERLACQTLIAAEIKATRTSMAMKERV